MNQITGQVRKCIRDYGMIRDGDRVVVGVSGGKDSLITLAALAALRPYYPERFTLSAMTLDMGFPDMDFSGVAEFCRGLDVPYEMVKSDIKAIVFDERREKNPCSLCAKLRRGALHNAARERGYNKIALGHHFDDAVETFVLSLLYEGRINCFEPVTTMDRAELTQIRPLLYVGEGKIRNTAERLGFPVVPSTCPRDGESKREEVKVLLRGLSAQYPDVKSKIFGAMQRYPLAGWGVQNSHEK